MHGVLRPILQLVPVSFSSNEGDLPRRRVFFLPGRHGERVGQAQCCYLRSPCLPSSLENGAGVHAVPNDGRTAQRGPHPIPRHLSRLYLQWCGDFQHLILHMHGLGQHPTTATPQHEPQHQHVPLLREVGRRVALLVPEMRRPMEAPLCIDLHRSMYQWSRGCLNGVFIAGG